MHIWKLYLANTPAKPWAVKYRCPTMTWPLSQRINKYGYRRSQSEFFCVKMTPSRGNDPRKRREEKRKSRWGATLQWSVRVPYRGGTSSSCSSFRVKRVPHPCTHCRLRSRSMRIQRAVSLTIPVDIGSVWAGNEPQSPVAPLELMPPFPGYWHGFDKLNKVLWKHLLFCS